jgi:Fis family transcriptional regulator
MYLEKAISEINELFFQENEGKVYRCLTDSFEKPLLARLMEYTKGNQMKAAQILGINRNTLRTKLKKYSIIGSR